MPDLDDLAALVGLTLAPGHRPGVERFFALAQEMADRLEALVREARPLVVAPATAEPSPVAPVARAETVPEAMAMPERPSGHAVPAGNAQDVPRSQAERDLLRALRLAR